MGIAAQQSETEKRISSLLREYEITGGEEDAEAAKVILLIAKRTGEVPEKVLETIKQSSEYSSSEELAQGALSKARDMNEAETELGILQRKLRDCEQRIGNLDELTKGDAGIVDRLGTMLQDIFVKSYYKRAVAGLMEKMGQIRELENRYAEQGERLKNAYEIMKLFDDTRKGAQGEGLKKGAGELAKVFNYRR